MYQPVDGVKQIEGILEGITDGIVMVTDEKEKKWEIPLERIAKTKLAVVF